MKFFVQIVLISIGNGKKNLNERMNSKASLSLSLTYSITFRYLQAFQKVRDCSYIHHHAGTSAKIQVNQFLKTIKTLFVSFLAHR
jgi:hypothetical protein